uniref:Uncharacterized protein n=1 Tax=Oryza rufipogon TaxID=4529 RepID=A0A0E0PD32_ORYRU
MHTRSTVSHRATRRLDVSLSSSTTTEPRGLSITLPRHTLPLHPCPRKRARVRYEAGREERPRHGHRSLRRRYDQLRRQEAAPRGRRAPPVVAPAVGPRAAVLAAHADPAQPRARDRHVLRAAGHGEPAGPGSVPAADGARARALAGGRGGCRGGAAHRGEEGAEAVGEADVPGCGRHVQPRLHVHGRRRRVLPLPLATGGWDGVLGAVGAPLAVARLPVAHARVAPPCARGPVRAQRRVRHHQRRAGHLPPRLRLLPPGHRPRPLLRRGPRDYAVRHGLHVRPRRPGPPPLPRRPHRECALLPASGRGPQDTPHGQVRGRTVWAVSWTQGAGGGWWSGRAGEGACENQPELVILTAAIAASKTAPVELAELPLPCKIFCISGRFVDSINCRYRREGDSRSGSASSIRRCGSGEEHSIFV